MLTPCLPTDAELVLPAPAKLNLFLHILGRRPDGYHDLQTIFQFLDYADHLAFKLRTDGIIKLHTAFSQVPHDDNLIVKAAKLLQQQTNSKLGVDIWIDKKLPMGGGIGGGSSNAATTLLAVNKLWNTQQTTAFLSHLGLTLGADVPVFVLGRAAFAEGVGEQLKPINCPEPWFLVGVPPVAISTASVFNDPELTRNTPSISYQQASTFQGHNDCQAVVAQHYPAVKEAMTLMGQFAPTQLTGTGACLFAAFETEQQASIVKEKLADKLPCFVAKGTNTSLLHRTLIELS